LTTKKDILALAAQFEKVMRGIDKPFENRFTATKRSSSKGWDASEQEINQFHSLMRNLAEQVFGIDSDGDCQIKFVLIDRKRDDTFHFETVRDVPFDSGSLEALKRNLDGHMLNMSIAQKQVDTAWRILGDHYKQAVASLRMKRQAVGCDVCKGKGHIHDDRPYKAREQDPPSHKYAYYKPSYERFCPKCQDVKKHYYDATEDELAEATDGKKDPT
jgi:hypothetical protein